MAQFSDITNKNGLIQLFEFWTRQPDGTVSGDTTKLKIATTRLNAAFENILPLLLAFNDQVRWDDLNNTDAPIGYTNIVANQHDYKITVDDNSYDILNITHVRILPSATATQYVELERMTADDPDVAEVLDPSSTRTGTPSRFLELGNTIYFDALPSYSATNGLALFFGRQQQYFVSTDTTKEPGIPLPFHELLALQAALDWNVVNRTTDAELIRELRGMIQRKTESLKDFTDLRHPTNVRMTMKRTNTR